MRFGIANTANFNRCVRPKQLPPPAGDSDALPGSLSKPGLAQFPANGS